VPIDAVCVFIFVVLREILIGTREFSWWYDEGASESAPHHCKKFKWLSSGERFWNWEHPLCDVVTTNVKDGSSYGRVHIPLESKQGG